MCWLAILEHFEMIVASLCRVLDTLLVAASTLPIFNINAQQHSQKSTAVPKRFPRHVRRAAAEGDSHRRTRSSKTLPTEGLPAQGPTCPPSRLRATPQRAVYYDCIRSEFILGSGSRLGQWYVPCTRGRPKRRKVRRWPKSKRFLEARLEGWLEAGITAAKRIVRCRQTPRAPLWWSSSGSMGGGSFFVDVRRTATTGRRPVFFFWVGWLQQQATTTRSKVRRTPRNRPSLGHKWYVPILHMWDRWCARNTRPDHVRCIFGVKNRFSFYFSMVFQ